jgi:NADPH:quinone reductase-like Zn-dependent oxidoreductase
MRQIVIVRHGAPEVLQARQVPDPVPGDGEVRIAVRAAGVNFADVLARLGLYPDAPKPLGRRRLRSERRDRRSGPSVTTHPTRGDRAVAHALWGYADRVVVRAGEVGVLDSNSLGDAEAAAIPVNYLTALIALYRPSQYFRGRDCADSWRRRRVGIAATQLRAPAWRDDPGHRVGGETRRDPAARCRSRDRLSDRGRHPRRRSPAPNGRGVDVVLDPIGGRSFADSYRLLAPLGRLVMYGASSIAPGERRSLWRALVTMVRMPAFKPLSLMNRNRGVFGLNLGHLWDERRHLTEGMTLLLGEVAAGRLRPAVARTFPLEQAADAHRFMQSRANIGKVVLTT